MTSNSNKDVLLCNYRSGTVLFHERESQGSYRACGTLSPGEAKGPRSVRCSRVATIVLHYVFIMCLRSVPIDGGRTTAQKLRTVLQQACGGEFGFLFDPNDSEQASRAIEQCFLSDVSSAMKPPKALVPVSSAIEIA